MVVCPCAERAGINADPIRPVEPVTRILIGLQDT
jgi:hypothetical protein